jgi:RecA-family ATPase
VLYLDGENPLRVAKQRLSDLGIPETNGLRVWGGWVCDPPPGPDSAIVRDFVQEHKPLLIWDSLIDFHDGDEQSASETRAFMKHFRVLVNLGATVFVLHHTGKTLTSQDYRGSSDIKAAVDMAYCVEPEFKDGCIQRLTLRNFKGRFAPGRHVGLEFVPKKGFVACKVPDQPSARDAMQTVAEIVAAHPGSNQSQIVALAQQAAISKHQVEECLKGGRFNRERGNRNEWLYTVAEVAPNSQTPAAIEEGNREIEPSLLR